MYPATAAAHTVDAGSEDVGAAGTEGAAGVAAGGLGVGGDVVVLRTRLRIYFPTTPDCCAYTRVAVASSPV
jgi:hypothetical protein